MSTSALPLGSNTQRYEAVLRISQALSACREPEELARTLADQLIDFLSFDHLDVVIFKENSTEVEWQAWGKGPLPSPDLPIEELPGWNVYNSQELLHIRDWSKDERFPRLKKLGTELGVASESIGSIVRVPLTTPTRRLGTLGIGSAPGVSYSTEDIGFLQLVARVVAYAIDDGLNLRRAQQQTRRYEALIRIANSIRAQKNSDELFHVLADELQQVAPADAILQFDGAANRIRYHIGPACRSGINLPKEYNQEETLAAFVYREQQPVVLGTLEGETRFPALIAVAREAGLQSACALPLTTAYRQLGTLELASVKPNAYPPDEVRFCTLVADQIALAMDDAMSFQESQRARGRLQLLLNLTNRITSNLELREVLRAISANIREVMDCDGAAILLPGAEPGTFKLYALDFPGRKGLVNEELVLSPYPDDPANRAFETLQPVIATLPDPHAFGRAYEMAVAEGIKSVCFIPLVNRGRGLGVLEIARTSEGSFTPEDVDFLTQAAGQIAIAIENALAYKEISDLKDKLAQEKLYLEEEIRSEMNFENIIGNSPAIKHVLELVETVAPSDSTVLLLGETGTGKELVARAIHDRSRRKDRAFVKLNCAAIPTGLLESELFGHEKGAFTGAIAQKVGRMEVADQGTLFLDEVGDIPIEIQPKLLRALQEREFERLGSTHTRKVNVRLVAATNCDLEKMIANKEFRSDLYYRLKVFPIRIPPLRERKEDIPLLVRYFVQKFAKQMQKKIETIPAAMMKGLVAWDWPGNIRELENFIERAVILTRGRSLEAPLAELRKPQAEGPTQTKQAQAAEEDIARIVKQTISAMDGRRSFADEYAKKQREEIVRALTESKGRVGGDDGAAVRMAINRTTRLSRMRKFGLNPQQYA